MSREEFEQRWARKSLREMLSAVEERVGKLKESMEDAKEDSVQELLDSQRKKLTERNDALKAMMMALKEETMTTTRALSTRIEELEGELALCRVAVEKGVENTTLNNEDRMENYFCAKGIVDDAVKFYPEFVEEEARAKLQGITQRGTVGEYVREFKELMLQVSDVTEKEALLAFQNGLKPWVRQEVEQRGVQKLSEAMTVVESVVKLGLGKDKLRSSKSEERGICEMDHKEDIVDGNGNGDNGGNGKPRVGKKKPKRKRDKLKCFLCDGPHMLKKCPRKSALKEKPVHKALVLGSSTRGVKAKEAKSEKKPVGCFLCHGASTQGRGELVIGLRGKSCDENNEAATNEAQVERSVGVGRVVDKASTYGRGGWCIRIQGKRSDAGGTVDQSKCKGALSKFLSKEAERLGPKRSQGWMVRVKKRRKSRQKSRMKGKAKASRRDR
ncbi:hypothetical protein Gotur_026789, partial [Gossypium turneri]